MAQSMTVSQFIESRPVSRLQVRMMVLCILVLMVDGFDSNSLGYMVPTLAPALGVSPGGFAPAFSAGLLGLGLGALLFGWLADRFGRRALITFCVVWFGVFTLGKAFVTTLPALIVLQFIAGLGLGGALPHSIALVVEYVPRRMRATLVAVVSAGLSSGGALGGIPAAYLIPAFGWQSMFWVGGLMPILLIWPLLAWMPESLRFSVLQGRGREEALRIERELNPGVRDEDQPLLVTDERDEGVPVVQLFREGRATVTCLLWLASVLDLMSIYFFTSYLTTLGRSIGLSPRELIWITVFFQTAAVFGPFLVGPLLDRFRGNTVLALAYFLTAIFCASIGAVGVSFALVSVLVVGFGFFVIGGHVGLATLAGYYYPTFMRSTGIGWMIGFGRMVALAGPLFIGFLLATGWSVSTIFYTLAIVPLLASAVFVVIGRVQPHMDQTPVTGTAARSAA